MGAFLAVAQGSDEPLKFLEIEYVNGVSGNLSPIVLVCKLTYVWAWAGLIWVFERVFSV